MKLAPLVADRINYLVKIKGSLSQMNIQVPNPTNCPHVFVPV